MGTGVSSTSRREASMATYGVVSARGATKRRMRARSEASLSSLVDRATGVSTVRGIARVREYADAARDEDEGEGEGDHGADGGEPFEEE